MGDYIFDGALYLIAIGFLVFSFVKDKKKTKMALKKAWKAFENLLPMLLGIIIIVGIIIAVLDPQLIAKLIGKNSGFFGVLIGAWSTTKIPMFLFEMSSMGAKFAITRLLIDIPGIIIIAYAIYFMIPKKERERIYKLDAKNPDTV